MRLQLIIASSLLLLILGCRASKPIIIDNHSRDSIYIREVLRDTVVHIKADSSLVRALIECDSLGRAYIGQIIELNIGDNLSPPSISINDNILLSTAKVDSIEIYLRLKDRYTERVTDISTTQIIEVNNLTLWQKAICSLGYMSCGVIVLFLFKLLLNLYKGRL